MNNNQYKQPDYGAEMSPVAPQRSALSVLVASSLGLASVVIVISIFILRRMSNANRNKDDEVEYKEFIVPKKESVPVQPSVAQFIQPTEESSSLFENLGLTRKESVLHHDPNPVDQDSSLGRLQFGLNYDKNAATLSVNIFQAVGLKPADVNGLADPYVRVCLLPEFVHRKSTRAKRATLDPIFEETLKFMCCDLEKLQEMTLCLQVMDYDRFKWDDPMGEVLLPLNRVRLSTNPVFWKNLRKCSAKQIGKGELHLSVCYVTREERLVVGIDKARGLPPKDLNGLADPYVKIWILEDGAKMLKKKTATRPNTLCPIWNESFHFSIPQDKLDNTQIMISINSVTVRYQIKIEGAVFVGQPRPCAIEAKGSAAKEALAALSVFDNNEKELRKRLGIEQRIFLQQADNIRDELRVIKQRSTNLTPVIKSAIVHSIVDVYTILDFIEALFAREEKNDT